MVILKYTAYGIPKKVLYSTKKLNFKIHSGILGVQINYLDLVHEYFAIYFHYEIKQNIY